MYVKLTSNGAIALSLLACAGPAWTDGLPWRVERSDHRIVLSSPAPKSGIQREPMVFFVDLSRLGIGPVDTRSMRLLTGGKGQAVPFSLDYRYGDRRDLPLPDPRYPDPTGYWGYKYAAADEKLRRLGFLSFEPCEGEDRYVLYFSAAKSSMRSEPQPRPAVRPWWIEQCRDPTIAVNENGDARPDYYGGWRREGWRHVKRPSPEGQYCFELSRPDGGRLITQAGLFDFDLRIAGRRIVLYHLLYAEKGLTGRNILLPLPSALRSPPRIALHFHNFGDIPPRTWYALCIEGRVSESFEKSDTRLYANYSGPCLLGAVHLQFPPERASANLIDIGTDLAVVGDRVPLTWQSDGKPYLYPIRLPLETRQGPSRLLQAERVEAWPDGFQIEATLAPADSRQPVRRVSDTAEPGRPWRGFLPLDGLKPGTYTVRLTVRSRRVPAETVAQIERRLRVIDGPFTTWDGE